VLTQAAVAVMYWLTPEAG